MKIEVNESLVNYHLEWLSKGKNHGLNETGTNEIIRYLLKKVAELEEILKDYESRTKTDNR